MLLSSSAITFSPSQGRLISLRFRRKQRCIVHQAGIAQLGERQTEDLKVACSIHAHRIFQHFTLSLFSFSYPNGLALHALQDYHSYIPW